MTSLDQISPRLQRFIRSYQQGAPVDVVGIATKLGVNVWEDELASNVSGKLLRDSANGGSSGYSIIVNGSEPTTRKRFTVAHEIAHFLLHRGTFGSAVEDDVYYRSRLSDAMETEANRLAADILMPKDLIANLAQSEGITDLTELAKRLQVSEIALKIRVGIPVG